MRKMRHSLCCLLLSVLASIGLAPVSAGADITQIRDGAEFQIRNDRAYIRMRYESNTSTMTVMLLRVPSSEELAAYERAKRAAYEKAGKKAGDYGSFVFAYEGAANLYEVNPKKAFGKVGKDGKAFTAVVELPAGDFIVYGLGWGGFLQQCFCYGTVGFAAQAGKITDIGKVLVAKSWQPSGVPELDADDDLGPIGQMDYGLFAAGIRPSAKSEIPTQGMLAAAIPADFYAVGHIRELNTLLMSRLAPIPGVLAYDSGKVLDVGTGKEAPPNF